MGQSIKKLKKNKKKYKKDLEKLKNLRESLKHNKQNVMYINKRIGKKRTKIRLIEVLLKQK